MDCTEPEFWEQRYRANKTPWDLRGVPPALVRFLRATAGEQKGRVLLPGCGSGYEVRAFHDAGWQPLAIDFSPAAVARAQEILGDLARTVQLADFFVDDLGSAFDLIYERTFLCSLPPARWPDYVSRMQALLKPGGRLAGIFAYGDEPEPPPFLLNDAEARALFDPAFAPVESTAIPAEESLPLFAGRERWQVWQRK